MKGVSDVLRICYKLNHEAMLRSDFRDVHSCPVSFPTLLHYPHHAKNNLLHPQSTQGADSGNCLLSDSESVESLNVEKL